MLNSFWLVFVVLQTSLQATALVLSKTTNSRPVNTLLVLITMFITMHGSKSVKSLSDVYVHCVRFPGDCTKSSARVRTKLVDNTALLNGPKHSDIHIHHLLQRYKPCV
jgi:hypothetical protein